ncbi:MAG: serine/threonine-protein kinase [Pseudomonadota bacterium]
MDSTRTDCLAGEALPIGATLLDGQFTITGHLGAGGFGKTYRAEDNVLGRTIVIKECFPEDFCVRENGKVVPRSEAYAEPFRSTVEMFVREARSLAKLRHPNIVGVHRAFEENQTAYMALDLIDGCELFSLLNNKRLRSSPNMVRKILLQLLDAVEKVHELDLLHRDISPDNIIMEPTGTPVLIDFGAARGDASRRTRAVSSLLVVKDGYSPHEFYAAGSEQTPSSDLYALGATFYHLLSGDIPPDSQARMMEIAGRKPDPCVPLAGRVPGYPPEFLEAIDKAMQIHSADRLQSAAEWRALITRASDAGAPVKTVMVDEAPVDEAREMHEAASFTPELQRSLSRLVAETNEEVRQSMSQPVKPKTRKAPPLRKPKRPAWVDEFNQESLELERQAAEQAAAEAAAEAERLAAEAAAEAERKAAEEAAAEAERSSSLGLPMLGWRNSPAKRERRRQSLEQTAPRSLGKLLSFDLPELVEERTEVRGDEAVRKVS